jgi:acyl-CoA synthetase (AMP-forming)/AMP-acid ligase II
MAASSTLAGDLDRARRDFKDSPCVLVSHGWLTFSEVGTLADSVVAGFTSAGASPGDRVVLWLPNSATLDVVTQATLVGGFVRVAVTHRLHVNEVVAISNDSGATLICCLHQDEAGLKSALAEVGASVTVIACSTMPGRGALFEREGTRTSPRVEPDDIAMLLYSSGTTGEPKGAIVTHGSWAVQARRSLELLPPLGPGDVVLAVAPMAHFGGSMTLHTRIRGAATISMAKFDIPAIASAAQTHAVSILPLAPVMLSRLVEAGVSAWPSLRSIPYGGSPIGIRQLADAVRDFPGLLTQFYGLAEALVPVAAMLPTDHARALTALDAGAPDEAARLLASAGYWSAGTEIRLADSGEAWFRGEGVTRGYWVAGGGVRRAVDDDGWFPSGDIVRVDHDGLVSIVGRSSEVINTGGFNVHPSEVERAVRGLDFVAEAVAFGAPDPRWGEGVHLALALRTGAELSEDTVRELVLAACRARIADYKRPVALHFVSEIPRTVAGKVDRRRLRTQVMGDDERSATADAVRVPWHRS